MSMRFALLVLALDLAIGGEPTPGERFVRQLDSIATHALAMDAAMATAAPAERERASALIAAGVSRLLAELPQRAADLAAGCALPFAEGGTVLVDSAALAPALERMLAFFRTRSPADGDGRGAALAPQARSAFAAAAMTGEIRVVAVPMRPLGAGAATICLVALRLEPGTPPRGRLVGFDIDAARAAAAAKTAGGAAAGGSAASAERWVRALFGLGAVGQDRQRALVAATAQRLLVMGDGAPQALDAARAADWIAETGKDLAEVRGATIESDLVQVLAPEDAKSPFAGHALPAGASVVIVPYRLPGKADADAIAVAVDAAGLVAAVHMF